MRRNIKIYANLFLHACEIYIRKLRKMKKQNIYVYKIYICIHTFFFKKGKTNTWRKKKKSFRTINVWKTSGKENWYGEGNDILGVHASA